jgi:hypothetical protein
MGFGFIVDDAMLVGCVRVYSEILEKTALIWSAQLRSTPQNKASPPYKDGINEYRRS